VTAATARAAPCQEREQRELDKLADEFPDWGIWRSAKGHWWATRRGNIPPRRDRPPEWAMTIDADSPDELRLGIETQAALPESV
jgi:hypothetical protein